MDYDPKSGVFTWLVGNKRSAHAGDIAGSKSATGHLRTKIGGVEFALHRLAWQHFHGTPPAAEIDHVNGDRLDNRIVNLREATSADNNRNRKLSSRNVSGKKGVFWNKQTGGWQAKIVCNYKQFWLGSFSNLDDAHAAYAKAAKKLFGEFARLQ